MFLRASHQRYVHMHLYIDSMSYMHAYIIFQYIHIYTYIKLCKHMYICICMCIHIYIYIHLFLHIDLHLYLYIHTEQLYPHMCFVKFEKQTNARVAYHVTYSIVFGQSCCFTHQRLCIWVSMP